MLDAVDVYRFSLYFDAAFAVSPLFYDISMPILLRAYALFCDTPDDDVAAITRLLYA